MKKCPNCREETEDNFDLCWNCNYSLPDGKVVEFVDLRDPANRKISCLRCNDSCFNEMIQ